jgi:uracil DNA glycosylase
MKKPHFAHESWMECPAFELLPNIIKQIHLTSTRPSDIKYAFRAFEMPVDEVKAIFVGMSPYPGQFRDGSDHACGYAFAIEENIPYVQWPASLKKIAEAVKELTEQEPIENYFIEDLRLWRNQGVLLLNAALTTAPTDPKSHLTLWEPFINSLIAWLNSKKSQVIYYFIGKDAQKFSSLIYPMWNPILMGEHPARAAREDRAWVHKFKDFELLYREIYKEDFIWSLPF